MDGATLIEVENMAANGSPPDPAEDKRGFSLHSALKGKRVAAWGLLAAIMAGTATAIPAAIIPQSTQTMAA